MSPFASPVSTGFGAATDTPYVYAGGNTTQPIDIFHLGGRTDYVAGQCASCGTTVVFSARVRRADQKSP